MTPNAPIRTRLATKTLMGFDLRQERVRTPMPKQCSEVDRKA